ncbi:hypothetical protein [Pontibacillus salipaludis]|uniref:Uncharacterized protein n=1 Tax=Pontibacillus salipaludis TaxID=1697394 RepID=A0ABQ1PS10_9BACI|nr:hypothetical protein [Pontibacillus salipaludis]GGD02172.1 hypothetical protein GCM10011389_07000 [Pontibacillus salipaludis]
MKKMGAMVWSMLWVLSLASVVKAVTVSNVFPVNVSIEGFSHKNVRLSGNKGRNGVLDYRSMKRLCQTKEFWCKARGSPRGKIDELIVYLVRVRSSFNELPCVSQ